MSADFIHEAEPTSASEKPIIMGALSLAALAAVCRCVLAVASAPSGSPHRTPQGQGGASRRPGAHLDLDLATHPHRGVRGPDGALQGVRDPPRDLHQAHARDVEAVTWGRVTSDPHRSVADMKLEREVLPPYERLTREELEARLDRASAEKADTGLVVIIAIVCLGLAAGHAVYSLLL